MIDLYVESPAYFANQFPHTNRDVATESRLAELRVEDEAALNVVDGMGGHTVVLNAINLSFTTTFHKRAKAFAWKTRASNPTRARR